MTKAPYSKRSDLEKVTANWNKTLGLFARREYSLSILRATVTAELALNYAIRQELHARRALPAGFVDSLLKWANGIDGKIRKLLLPILFGTPTHKRAKDIAKSLKSLNEHRNAIAHRGEFRAKETAQEQPRLARTQILTLVGLYDPSFTLKEFNPRATHEISMMIPGGPMVQMPAHPSSDED